MGYVWWWDFYGYDGVKCVVVGWEGGYVGKYVGDVGLVYEFKSY